MIPCVRCVSLIVYVCVCVRERETLVAKTKNNHALCDRHTHKKNKSSSHIPVECSTHTSNPNKCILRCVRNQAAHASTATISNGLAVVGDDRVVEDDWVGRMGYGFRLHYSSPTTHQPYNPPTLIHTYTRTYTYIRCSVLCLRMSSNMAANLFFKLSKLM